MATEQFLVSAESAELYEERFVPALFRQWVEPVLAAATARPGDDVLDVACGTGVVARAAIDRVGRGGRVTGVDVNPAMLAVARRAAPGIDWREGDASALPFQSRAFDVVLCQAGIFFFPDPTQALSEMARVTRPHGRVVVQSFSSLSSQPAYGPWVGMVARHAGAEAVQLLGTYWRQGDPEALTRRCADAGLSVRAVHQHVRPAYFPDITTMVLTELDATPLGDRLTQVDRDRILRDSQSVLDTFIHDDRLVVPIAGFVLVASPA